METKEEIIVTSGCLLVLKVNGDFVVMEFYFNAFDGQTLQFKLKMRFLTFFMSQASSSNIDSVHCPKAKAQFGYSKSMQSPYLPPISAYFKC